MYRPNPTTTQAMILRLKNILALALILPLLILSSCKKDDEKKAEESTTPHTLIYYFTGTSLSLHFYNNIAAAEVAVRQGVLKDGRIVCFFQSSDRRKAEVIELVHNNGLCERKVLATYELPAIMDAERFTYNLKEVMALAPADSYGLVMAGHATGWIPINGVAQSSSAISGGKKYAHTINHEQMWKKQDSGVETRFFGEKYSSTAANAFDIPDLAKGLSDTGVYFDYILFDACLMANVEALYDLRNNARYIIASPCEIMAAGFPYTEVVPLLMKDGGRSHDLAGVCEAYYKYYENSKAPRSGSAALVDCAQLEALASAVKAVNTAKQKSYDISNIQTFEGQRDHVFFDLGDYIEQMCDDENALKAFRQQMDKTIRAKYSLPVFWSNLGSAGEYTIRTFSGLTTSAPSVLYRDDYAKTAWYKATN